VFELNCLPSGRPSIKRREVRCAEPRGLWKIGQKSPGFFLSAWRVGGPDAILREGKHHREKEKAEE
jgi:hypothetical protein